MKKETINTFNDGMVKDLHPLTTPNNVLTDALNATFITYNGNENILQNDMGNVEIKHALLQAGYVPVGMKEHGGIVYVAAYNPETGKGQVGSFPSPQLLWEGENWTVNKPNNILANVTVVPNFYDENFIINEIIKQEIFSDANGDARTFHPGDKFIIGLSQLIHTLLLSYINNDYLDVQLGVVKSDGGIEIMRTWSKTEPDNIFYVGDATAEGVMNKTNTKVFDATSSGQLILIINLHTFDSFSLNKTYSLVNVGGTELIQVQFKGEAKKDGDTYLSSDNDGKLRLSKTLSGITTSDNTEINVVGTSGTQSLTIYPNVPFGIIKRMGRNVSVDFDKIRNNQDDFGEWRFFVTENYVKIGWSYDFYNLDGSKEIDYIKMYFHLLEDGYDRSKAALHSIEFLKEYYSGNFEDFITYSDIGLRYKRIYIVEVVKKFKDSNTEDIITFKMLYLSKFYNDQYNGFYKNNAIGNSQGEVEAPQDKEFSSPQPQSVSITLKTLMNTDVVDSTTYVKGPGEQNFDNGVNTTYVNLDLYIREVSLLPAGTSTNAKANSFLTKIENEYTSNATIKGEINDISEDIIGVPRKTLIANLLNSYNVNTIVLECDRDWNESTSLVLWPEISSISLPSITYDSRSIDDNILTIGNICFKDYRLIQGLSSGVLTSTFKAAGLMPLYSPKYSSDIKNSIAPYWNYENVRAITGSDEDGLFYNSLLSLDGKTITEGPDSGAGLDDGGLRTCSRLMGDPLTNLFVGDYGRHAHLAFDGKGFNTSVQLGMHWPSSGEWDDGQELDAGDNFAIACWKFTNGELGLVNLMTSKYASIKNTAAWPRVEVMLRCILSQIFTVRKVNKSVTYITTNSEFYRYLTGTATLKITLTESNSADALLLDIMCSEDYPNTTLTSIFLEKWGNGTLKIKDNGDVLSSSDPYGTPYTAYNIKNLIPIVLATKPSILDIEIEVPDKFAIDPILANYMGVGYIAPTGDSEYNIQEIYTIDTSRTTENANACAKGSLVSNMDGAYEWKTTPVCKPLSQNNGQLSIYKWDNSSTIINFPNFDSHFTTRAKMEDWRSVDDDSMNEVLAEVKNNTVYGIWTYKLNEDAPDLHPTTLYSSLISLIKTT